MRLISIDEYNPKLMQLAKPVFDKHRRVLLAAGRTIHPIYLKKLMDLDIRYLFVEDAISFGISMEEMVEVPTWIDATEIVQNAFKTVAQNKEIPIRDLQKLVIRLINEVSKRKAIVLIPTSSLEEDLREYAHAVNVTLLSLQIAKKLNISQIQLKDLALGTLLHDIGKVLTKNEEDHMFAGFEYLRKVREVSLLSAHVAFQHHEAVDGSGKPRRMREGEIHEFAQLCAITNLYENTLSKEGLPPHEVLEFIMTKSGTVFSPDLVKLFVQEVPYYIPGTRVLMNNGRKAIITKIIGNLHRPYIRYLDTGEEISLASNYTLLITELVNE